MPDGSVIPPIYVSQHWARTIRSTRLAQLRFHDLRTLARPSPTASTRTFEERQQQTAQTMDALFAVEVDQATLTLQAWESGLSIEVNADLLPAAWLAVANVVAPPADTTTSPQHGYMVRR
jgi:hypothetical protein